MTPNYVCQICVFIEKKYFVILFQKYSCAIKMKSGQKIPCSSQHFIIIKHPDVKFTFSEKATKMGAIVHMVLKFT